MKNVLADLALESEAATALALRLARAVDRSENGTTRTRRVMRRAADADRQVLDLQARQRTSRRRRWSAWAATATSRSDGEGVMARIYREMPLNSIWEGAGNIMALDLLRALRTGRWPTR